MARHRLRMGTRDGFTLKKIHHTFHQGGLMTRIYMSIFLVGRVNDVRYP